MTTPSSNDRSRGETPPHRALRDAGSARKSEQPVRQLRATAWKCPRCGTRKLLRGDRRG